MIRVDISKAVPPNAFNYLAAFIPGLFFEISVLLGNSGLIRALAGQSQSGYATGYYTQLVIALILAFIIGNGFMFLVRLIQLLLGYLYRLSARLSHQFGKRLLLPNLNRLLQKPGWKHRRWLQQLFRSVQMESLGFCPRLMEVQRCWHLVVTELLRRRYKIKPRRTENTDWGVWYSVLATLSPEDMRGSILTIAFHAAGWGGITATHFAPTLKSAYYVGFSLLLIFFGIVHDWFVVKRLYDPVFAGLIRVRAALTELRDITPSTQRERSRAEAPADVSIEGLGDETDSP